MLFSTSIFSLSSGTGEWVVVKWESISGRERGKKTGESYPLPYGMSSLTTTTSRIKKTSKKKTDRHMAARQESRRV